jgi:hypothetical protein
MIFPVLNACAAYLVWSPPDGGSPGEFPRGLIGFELFSTRHELVWVTNKAHFAHQWKEHPMAEDADTAYQEGDDGGFAVGGGGWGSGPDAGFGESGGGPPDESFPGDPVTDP